MIQLEFLFVGRLDISKLLKTPSVKCENLSIASTKDSSIIQSSTKSFRRARSSTFNDRIHFNDICKSVCQILTAIPLKISMKPLLIGGNVYFELNIINSST